MTRLRRPLALLSALALATVLSACAGGPTSSPEAGARTFLEALKANDLAIAVALVDPTSGVIPAGDPLPAGAQAAGEITDYRIINQVQNQNDTTTITAELTGGTVGILTLTLGKGGPRGDDWLVRGLDPGFSLVRFDVPKHWTVTLADGTVLQADDEDEVHTLHDYFLLPGGAIAGGVWSNDDGYYEPAPTEVRLDAGNTYSIGSVSLTATGKLLAKAKQDIESAMSAQRDEVVASAKRAASLVHIVAEPSIVAVTVGGVEPYGNVKTEITIDSGEYQLCGHWSSMVTYDLKSFFFVAEEGVYTVPFSYSPYYDEIDPSRFLYDHFEEKPYNAVPLSECGL